MSSEPRGRRDVDLHRGAARDAGGRGRARRAAAGRRALGARRRRRRPVARRANLELARVHHAAAGAIWTTHHDSLRWSRGEDFEASAGSLATASYAPQDVACLSAHQMGSCRMGSAFPSAPGVNPMVSIMALAHRTAAMILDSP